MASSCTTLRPNDLGWRRLWRGGAQVRAVAGLTILLAWPIAVAPCRANGWAVAGSPDGSNDGADRRMAQGPRLGATADVGGELGSRSCWDDPSPLPGHVEDLFDVTLSGPAGGWAVAEHGALVRYALPPPGVLALPWLGRGVAGSWPLALGQWLQPPHGAGSLGCAAPNVACDR